MTIGFDLESFKAKFKGGARQNLFLFAPRFPAGVSPDITTEEMQYLVRATSLPETTSEEVLVNWQGYDFKMAGKYTFTDFTCTFNVDMDSRIIHSFDKWMNHIHNVTTNEYKAPKEYMADQYLSLLGYTGNVISEYKLFSAWPKTVGAVTLDYATSDVAQFDVTFSYQYHTITNSQTGM